MPGSIQPRGVFLAVTEPDLVVRHTSQNVAELLGHPVDDVLGHPLEHVLGAEAAGAIEHHVRTWGNLRAAQPAGWSRSAASSSTWSCTASSAARAPC